MVAMESTVQIRGEVKVSFRKLFTGGELAESIFTGFGEGTTVAVVAVAALYVLTDYHPAVLLAPDIWGDVIPINIDGQTTWRIGKDAFLACTSEVTRTNKSQGLGKGLCTLAPLHKILYDTASKRNLLFSLRRRTLHY